MVYTLQIYGTPFPLTDGYISYLSYGNPERTLNLPFFLSESYATTSTDSALWDIAKSKFIWQQPSAKCVQIGIIAGGVSPGTRPYINIITEDGYISTENSNNGLLVDETPGTIVYSNVDLNPLTNSIEFGDTIEISVVSTDDSILDKNLTISMVWVLE